MPEVIAQPRVDTLVSDGETGTKVRRTDYSGTAWYGERPDTSGGIVSFNLTYLNEDAAFFLPDSHPYTTGDLGDATVTCSVALQGQPGEASFITHAEASFTGDPRGGDQSWIALRIAVYGRQPLGVAYRVTAICPVIAVPSSRAIDLRGAFRRS
jgi:hypothetical protein